ncbi:hypothetical protein H2198_003132 [Neophaeococcomyces mojaviensis]|uniref:Uncharacterized protein n=1 Tax=Neophaeococcomyces mojaviensis TaxID=3383035 RepID=A0ACC3ACA3_9EURO|nr:hypothetical protein H2198_003132 [Knufia sp. JES_112]
MPEILWHSLRRHDYVVAASTMVTILITTIIVISTGLFVLESKSLLHEDTSYRVTSKFVEDSEHLNALYSNRMPLDVIDAIDLKNLSYPSGLTPEMTYQSFEPIAPLDAEGMRQEVQVTAIVSDLICSPATIHMSYWNISWSQCWDPKYQTQDYPSYETRSGSLKTHNCTIDLFTETDDVHVGSNNTLVNHFAIFDQGWCAENASNSNGISLLFGIGRIQRSGSAGPMPLQKECDYRRPNMTIDVVESKWWICTPRVSVASVNITFNSSEIVSGTLPMIDIDNNGASHIMNDSDITTVPIFIPFNDPLYVSSEVAGQPVLTDQYQKDFIGRVFRSAGTASIDDIFKSDMLLELTRKLYQRIIAASAHFGLRVDDDKLIQGVSYVKQNRLVVRAAPLRVIEVCLIISIIFMLYVTIFRRKIALATDSSRLAGLLMFMAMAPNISRTYAGTGHLDASDLQRDILVRVHKCEEPRQNDKNVNDEPEPGTTETNVPHGRVRLTWWRPILMSRMSRLAAIVLVCLVIITLEVLLWFSNHFDGLANVSLSGGDHLGWSIVPATTMVLIAMYWRALASQYKTFSPYVQLRNDTNYKALLWNFLSKTELEIFVSSLRHREIAVAVMALSVLLAAFLTIVVSGVWVPLSVPAIQSTSATIASWFNRTSLDNGTAGDNAFVSGLIFGANLSYPKWTYDNLALASISFDDASVDKDASLMRLQVPAVRTALDCTIFNEAQIPDLSYCLYTRNWTGKRPSYDPEPFRMCFKMPGPDHCAGTEPEIVVASDVGWVTLLSNIVSPDCPLLNLIWGRQNKTYGNGSADLPATYTRALSCYETIEQVDVSMTLRLPSLAIDESSPPTVVSPPRPFSSSAQLPLPYSMNTGSGLYTTGLVWENLVQKYNLTTAVFGDPRNIDRIVSSFKTAHGIVRAQQYHAALRTNSVSGISQNTSATAVRPNRYRLVQTGISTHVLCAILGVMVVCLGIASWFMSTNYVLPKNPCSIAAQISLFADSDILQDSQLIDDLSVAMVQGKPPLNLKQVVFRMGWLDRDTRQRFSIHALNSEKPPTQDT